MEVFPLKLVMATCLVGGLPLLVCRMGKRCAAFRDIGDLGCLIVSPSVNNKRCA